MDWYLCHGSYFYLDNLFALQSYCCTNFGISRPEFLAQFGLEEDVGLCRIRGDSQINNTFA